MRTKGTKALVLSSGGVDSATCLAIAVRKHGKENVSSLTMFYKNNDLELHLAQQLANHYGISHYTLNISGIYGGTELNQDTPFRGGLFLSIATAFAEKKFPKEVCFIYFVKGTDKDKFVDSITKSIILGTSGKKRVITPLANLDKEQVIEMGLFLDVPYRYTWTCEVNKHMACGKCPACVERKEAFRKNGIPDPIVYKK